MYYVRLSLGFAYLATIHKLTVSSG